ncbi:MAG: DUF2231 domain-containing protein [bacterium]|nr:DUF2231 domain-containing protein [bacterium]
MQLHPILVHLPIAASWLGLGFEIWSRLRDREEALWASDATVVAGAVGAIGAVISGKLVEEAVEEAVEDMPGFHDVFEAHERLGYVAAAAFLLVLAYRIWCRRRGGDALAGWGRLVTAALLVALTGATGFFGGRLVYEHGAGVTAPGAGLTAPGHDHEHESPDVLQSPGGEVEPTSEPEDGAEPGEASASLP